MTHCRRSFFCYKNLTSCHELKLLKGYDVFYTPTRLSSDIMYKQCTNKIIADYFPNDVSSTSCIDCHGGSWIGIKVLRTYDEKKTQKQEKKLKNSEIYFLIIIARIGDKANKRDKCV